MGELTFTRKDLELLLDNTDVLAETLPLAFLAELEGRSSLCLPLSPEDCDVLLEALDDAIEAAESEATRLALLRLYARVFACATAPPEADGGPPHPATGLDPDLGKQIENLLATHTFANEAQANRALQDLTDAHNNRPRAELGGLSPTQLRKLLVCDWRSPDSSMLLNRSLPIADLGQTRFFANARSFLRLLLDEGGTKATTAGNLNRKFAREISSLLPEQAPHFEFLERRCKAWNEDDMPTLLELRLVLQFSRLIRKTKGSFYVTKKGGTLLADDKAGELYALLFETFFLDLDLAILDRMADFRAVQSTFAYTLMMLSRQGRKWVVAKEFADMAFLPTVSAQIPIRAYSGESLAPDLLKNRILRPLLDFGLLERKVTQEDGDPFYNDARIVRKTPLFGGLVTFQV